MAQLIIQGAGESVIHELTGGVVSIGRHPGNAVVLDDGSVSSNHAAIISEHGKLIVHDLNSSNGTKVNGQRIEQIELNDGDAICFGAIECVFRATPPSSA